MPLPSAPRAPRRIAPPLALLVFLGSGLLSGCADPTVPAPRAAGPTRPLPPTWLATPTGCRIWDPVPAPEETVQWSGACVGGYGEGPGRVLWNRPFRSRNPDGSVSVDPSLPVTTGSWEGSLRHGVEQGPGVSVAYGPNGGDPRATTRANYVDGQAEGPGSTAFATGARFDGQFHRGFEDGPGRVRFGHGSRFEGDLLHGIPEGPGRLVIVPADAGHHGPGTFEGVWHHGCLPRDGGRVCFRPG